LSIENIKDIKILQAVREAKPLYFRRPDSMKLFGISPKTLANLASLGKGPQYYKRGRSVIYKVETFEAWLTSHPVLTSEQF